MYGSDTHGLTYTKRDINAEDIAIKIAQMFNLKTHIFKESLTVGSKNQEFEIHIPFSVQIHRSSASSDSKVSYLILIYCRIYQMHYIT